MSNLKITLKKSPIGCTETQKKTIKALGLRKIGSSVVKKNTPEIQGSIRKIEHLLSVEEIEA